MSEKAMTTRTTALDGLRGLCALMVVLSHLNIDATTINRVAPGWWHIIQPLVGKGTLYVAVLFVLTGYLMSSIYGRIHSWVNFMQRRYTRLFPLFITVSIFQTYYYFAVIMEKNRPNTMIIAAQCLGFAFVCGGLWRMYIKIRARSSGTILFRSFFILQLVVMAIYIAVVRKCVGQDVAWIIALTVWLKPMAPFPKLPTRTRLLVENFPAKKSQAFV
jgi:hypothetical protein